MNETLERFLKQHPHPHQPFWERPTLSRRRFFEILGTGITGYALFQLTRPLRLLAQLPVVPVSTAKNCIYILLSGAPSHTDTFDLKEGSWTPSTAKPTSYGEIRFPQGLMPNVAETVLSGAMYTSFAERLTTRNPTRSGSFLNNRAIATPACDIARLTTA